MRHNLYHIPPEQGPKIVGIGGGTGLSTLLRGLKLYTRNITAIVTVMDNGGGSGVLRADTCRMASSTANTSSCSL